MTTPSSSWLEWLQLWRRFRDRFSRPVRRYRPRRALTEEQRDLDDRISNALADAAIDGALIVERLGRRAGIGAEVRREQVAMVTAQLTAQQGVLWSVLRKSLRDALRVVGVNAFEHEQRFNWWLLQEYDRSVADAVYESEVVRAIALADPDRLRPADAPSLSERVWRTEALANGWVVREVNRSVLLGEGWRELADRVRSSVSPDSPGGVSYAAKRLARTELSRTFRQAQVRSHEGNPWVAGMRWNLSRSHPEEDECDEYDGQVYAAGDLPDSHPQCLCFLTAEPVPDEQVAQMHEEGELRDYATALLAANLSQVEMRISGTLPGEDLLGDTRAP